MKHSYFIAILSFGLLCSSSCNKSNTVKAGSKSPFLTQLIHVSHLSSGWYPQNKEILSRELDHYFDLAREYFPVAVNPDTIRALIVPHAGLYFSGLCAATAYQTLLSGSLEGREGTARFNKNTTIKRVIILCPSHTTFLKGCAVPNFDIYQTVLGNIEIDRKALDMLTVINTFKGDARAHEQEHAIEIQLPFLQKTIENFKLVPLIVGHTTDEDIDFIIKGLEKIIDKETLVVISSDFLHHGTSYEYDVFDRNIIDNIRFFDSQAVNIICTQDYRSFEQYLKKTGATICGQNALKILLGLINKRLIDGVNARLSCYYTSAHMNKARKQDNKIEITNLLYNISDQEARESVSYVGMVFTTQKYTELKKIDVLTGYEKKALLAIARRTVQEAFVDKKDQISEYLLCPIVSFGMQQMAGAFVTLHTKNGDLRGCIGNMISLEPLFQTVMRMSLAAAFQDTRFAPLTKKELENILFSISILTPPVKVDFYHDIKIGKHGVILNKINNTGKIEASSIFLPQVPTSYGWSIEETLKHLSLKAGLNSDAWQSGCQFEVFEGYEIEE